MNEYSFKDEGMSWTEGDIPDQTKRVALVTGGNGGLGLETTRALAAKGAHVIMAARNQQKATEAETGIRVAIPDASIEVRPLDLGSLASIQGLANSVLAEFDHLDLLINNAGVMAVPEGRTEDGFETQFGVNHLGHYALTAHLLPRLVSTSGSRVVTVTSTARHFGRSVDPDNPHLHGSYDEWRAYGQSKLANLHFAVGVENRFRAAGAETISLVAHPGLSETDLQPNSVRETEGSSQRFFEWMAAKTGMTAARGALPQLRAATDPNARGGELYAPRLVNNGAPVRRPLFGRSSSRESIETLFTVSKTETGIPFDVDTALKVSRS
jgi:NAD(P)-dependent dehydrogenase (short-subunit alcohol dehydrogenase family)